MSSVGPQPPPRTLMLDSTSFLSGNLVDSAQQYVPRFSLSTKIDDTGPSTTVSSWARPYLSQPTDEVGVVEWRSSAIGRRATYIKHLGQNVPLASFMKSANFGTFKHFGLGSLDVRWKETDGTWQCTTSDATILAVLHARIATRGTRIEVSPSGNEYLDNIVLTALLVLHGEHDWKAFKNRPQYPSPYAFSQSVRTYVPQPHTPVLTLQLSTNNFLEGVLSVGGQIMYATRTIGNRTSLLKYTWEETARLEEFASIEWLQSGLFGREHSIVTYRGARRTLGKFMWSSFLGNRMRRFGLPDFLPWLQWVEDPPAWQCFSHTTRAPLALLDRRFLSAGTNVEITLEGLEHLDAIILTTLLVIHGPFDWKRCPRNLPNSTQARRALPPSTSNQLTINPEPSTSRNALALTRTDLALRNFSEVNVQSRREDRTDDISTPPGLTRRASDSRLSGESIPAYSPPPRGFILSNHDRYYEHPHGTPMVSALPSRAPSPPPGLGIVTGPLNVNIARQLGFNSAVVPSGSITELPPPSYSRAPSYSSDHIDHEPIPSPL